MSNSMDRQFRPLPPTVGSVIAVNCAVANTVYVVDLCSVPSSLAADPSPLVNANFAVNPDQKNPVGHQIRITADGGNIDFLFGPNFNSVKNMSLVAFTTINGTTGAVTVNGNECDMVSSGRFKDLEVPQNGTAQTQNPPGAKSACRFIAVASTTAGAVARIYQRSP